MPDTTVAMTLRLPKATCDKLTAEAKRRGISRTRLIVALLDPGHEMLARPARSAPASSAQVKAGVKPRPKAKAKRKASP